MRESYFQRKLIDKLKRIFPDCFVLRNDPQFTQGMPDLLILIGDRWAMLEVKASEDAPERPNQPYLVDQFNNMSFAAFIHPQNEDEVLDALQSSFGVGGQARLFKS